MPPPAPIARSATPLWGEWPWCRTHPQCTRKLLEHASYPPQRKRWTTSVWGLRQGQEVSRAELAEREVRPPGLTSCPQDTRPTLWPGHRPFLPVMRSCRLAKLSITVGDVRSTGLNRYTNRRLLSDQLGYSRT